MSSLLPLAQRLDQLHRLLDQLQAAAPHRPLPIPDAVRYPDGHKMIERCRTRKVNGHTSVQLRMPRRMRKQIADVQRKNREVVNLNNAGQEAAKECLELLEQARPMLQPEIASAEHRGLVDALEGVKTGLQMSFANSWDGKPPKRGATMMNGRPTPVAVLKLWQSRREVIDAMRKKVRTLWDEGLRAAQSSAPQDVEAPPTPTPSRRPAIHFLSACPDEDAKYPRKALEGNSLDALAAFCEVRMLIRRSEGYRDLLRRGRNLPDGFYSWQHMPPNIEWVRERVERCRRALTVGFRRGLRSKEDRISDWTLDHERAIEQITPLAKALATFKESRWRKMNQVQRINYASPLLRDLYPHMESALGLAYAEAKGAAELLKLSKEDQRVVIDGAYASLRLDWLTREGNSRPPGAGSNELNAHVRTIVSIANDLKQYALAEKIGAAGTTVPKIVAFTKTALFDQFKGHLIAATKERLEGLNPAKEAGTRASGIAPEGEWSRPMSKTDMRVRLANLPVRKFNTFTKSHPIRQAGNRQLWQIRLDGMDKKTREKIEML
jgi:hypothetical protein